MKLEYLILGIVKHHPYTGYDIKKFLDGEGQIIRSSVPLSQIYNTLKRMVDQGWIKFIWRRRDGKPDIKEYQLTPSGNAELMAWIQAPVEPGNRISESEIFAKVWLSIFVDTDVVLAQLKDEMAFRQQQLSTAWDHDHSVNNLTSTDVDLSRAQLIADLREEFRLGAIQYTINWLEKVIAIYENPA